MERPSDPRLRATTYEASVADTSATPAEFEPTNTEPETPAATAQTHERTHSPEPVDASEPSWRERHPKLFKLGLGAAALTTLGYLSTELVEQGGRNVRNGLEAVGEGIDALMPTQELEIDIEAFEGRLRSEQDLVVATRDYPIEIEAEQVPRFFGHDLNWFGFGGSLDTHGEASRYIDFDDPDSYEVRTEVINNIEYLVVTFDEAQPRLGYESLEIEDSEFAQYEDGVLTLAKNAAETLGVLPFIGDDIAQNAEEMEIEFRQLATLAEKQLHEMAVGDEQLLYMAKVNAEDFIKDMVEAFGVDSAYVRVEFAESETPVDTSENESEASDGS